MIEEIFYSNTLPFATMFLVFFAITFFLLNRSVFRENTAVSVVIAICISALTVWGINNYTNYMKDISEFLGGFENSGQIVFIAIIVVVLFFLYKIFSKTGLNMRVVVVMVGMIGILIYFLPKFMNIYYLPEKLQEGWVRVGCLVVGSLLVIIGLFGLRMRRKKLFEIKKVN